MAAASLGAITMFGGMAAPVAGGAVAAGPATAIAAGVTVGAGALVAGGMVAAYQCGNNRDRNRIENFTCSPCNYSKNKQKCKSDCKAAIRRTYTGKCNTKKK